MKSYDIVGWSGGGEYCSRCQTGDVLCLDCARPDDDPELNPVFVSDDDGWGLTCDHCGSEIFEVSPEIDHVEFGNHADFTPEQAESAGCDECTAYLEDHDSHADDAYNLGAQHFEDHCWTCMDLVTAMEREHDEGLHSITTGKPNPVCPFCPEAWFKGALS